MNKDKEEIKDKEKIKEEKKEKIDKQVNKKDNNKTEKKVDNKKTDKKVDKKTDKKDINKEKNEIKTETKKKINKKDITKKQRKVVSTKNFILIVSVVVAFYIALIMFVNVVVNNDNLHNFDWTYSHMYKLSKESKNLIKSINEPIEITIDSRLDYTQVTEILNQVTKLNSLVTVKKTELSDTEDSTEENEENEETNYYGTVIVNASNREEMAFSFFDLNFDASLINKDTYKQYSLFEEKLMNSIISVLNGETDKTPSVAFLTGLEGSKIGEELINLYTELRSYGIVSIELDLKKEEIPESIKTIAIIGPMKDLDKTEYNKLIEFQGRGGNFVIAATFVEEKAQPRLEKLLSSYGVSLPVGTVIEYKDGYRFSILQRSESVMNYNNILLPIPTNSNEITKDMEFEGTAPFFPLPTKIDLDSEEELEKKNVTLTNSVLTSDKAIFKKDDVTEEDLLSDDLPEDAFPEIFVLGTTSEKEIADNVKSTAVIYSNYLFMTDLVLKNLIENELILQSDNLRLAKNSFTSLHPLKEKMLDIKKGLIVSPYKYESSKVVLHKALTYLFFMIPIIVIAGMGSYMLYKKAKLSKYGVKDKEINKQKNRV